MNIMLVERQLHERKAPFSQYALETLRTRRNTAFQGMDQTWDVQSPGRLMQKVVITVKNSKSGPEECAHGLALLVTQW